MGDALFLLILQRTNVLGLHPRFLEAYSRHLQGSTVAPVPHERNCICIKNETTEFCVNCCVCALVQRINARPVMTRTKPKDVTNTGET